MVITNSPFPLSPGWVSPRNFGCPPGILTTPAAQPPSVRSGRPAPSGRRSRPWRPEGRLQAAGGLPSTNPSFAVSSFSRDLVLKKKHLVFYGRQPGARFPFPEPDFVLRLLDFLFSRSISIFGRSISFSACSISIFVSSDFDFRRPAIQNQRRARLPSTICAVSMPVHLNRSDLLSPFMSAPKCCRSCCRVRPLGNV